MSPMCRAVSAGAQVKIVLIANEHGCTNILSMICSIVGGTHSFWSEVFEHPINKIGVHWSGSDFH